MRTAKEVYDDFSGRRKAILRALTTDADQLFAACDPARENLCLYGYPDGSWVVDLPAEEVPPEAPEPALGINFARDGMMGRDWLGLVAVHSDAWLIGLAFYKGARLNKEQREELFALINTHPTCYEVVSGRIEQRPSGKRGVPPNAARSSPKVTRKTPSDDDEDAEEYAEEEETAGATGNGAGWEDGEGDPCPQCGKSYRTEEFWIACDNCDLWYCGRCARMTQAKAEKTKNWNCGSCVEKRAQR
ncbi:MAG: hypothetical protein WDW38_004195 [Sanguina aurantia]